MSGTGSWSSFWLAAAIGVGVWSCQGKSAPQTSSSSHWATCRVFADCENVRGAVACEAGYCVDASGDPLAEPAAPSYGGGSGSGPSGGTPSAPEAGRGAQPAASGNGGASSSPGGDGGASASGGTRTTAGGQASGGADGGEPPIPSEGGTSTVGGSGSAGTGGSGGDLTKGGQYAIPDFDKSCETGDDCFVGLHYRDCCGSQIALGYNVSERDRFDALERALQPICDCLSRPTITEDGSPLDGSTAIVECVEQRCVARGTSARP